MSKVVAFATFFLSLCVAGAGCNSRAANAVSIDERKTLAYLASDELEGRGIGTAGLDRAADLIAHQFSAVGLRPLPRMSGYFQPFEITTATSVGPGTALRVADREFTAKEDFAPISFSAATGFSGPVVFVGYGMRNDEHHYDDYAGVDVEGKVVLAMRYEPRDDKGKSKFAADGWSDGAAIAAKAKLAREHGAVALLLVTPPGSPDQDRLMGLAMRQMGAGDSPNIPILHIKPTVAEELLRRGGSPELKALQRKIDQAVKPASFALAGVDASGNVDIERKIATVKNVVGYLPGSNANEYVVIGAHYDHLGRGGMGSLDPKSKEIHNGADDNASGVTALLKLAERFARARSGARADKPQRSMIFIAFTGEEEGLLGSEHFVDHSPVPIASITSMLNLDMVGRIRPAERAATTAASTAPATTASSAGLLYVGGSGTAPSFGKIVAQADARSPLQVKDIGKGGIGPSDHMSFALKRIPVLFLFSGLHSDYHRPSDDADKINYEGLDEVVDFAADLLTQMTAAPAEKYVEASDASPMRVGSGSGSRVTLGVVPDYSSFGQGGGVRISAAAAGSPAAAAGLQAGDTIVKFDQSTIDTLYDLSDALAKAKPGQKVKLQVKRGDAKTPIDMEATLAERKG
jgi:hypothetical protein